ncbi:beta-CASP ribonuclease aCPSF1 [Candidatus Woesearchaeota archaeon]|nr:beta-CASP ribonuclease aCPSF1 [Candidatus Woesearchaeota archaeon]
MGAASLTDIIKEILKRLPEDKVSDAGFEGANIVLYTKSKSFFLDNEGLIKGIVEELKKRVELRPDPAITMPPEEAKQLIASIIPESAGVDSIVFDQQRSRVIIEAEKPGLAIGKQGIVLRDIREKTLWVPQVRRKPAIRSKLIENIRGVIYQNSEYRRKFLNKIGHRIYDGWLREKKNEWIRLTYLGGGRQVGRSCLFLQTPESRVLLDCGVNVAAQDSEGYPYLDAPEFDLKELDAVVLSHAHLDHCGFIPYLYKYGFRGPVYCTRPTRDISALLLLDYLKIMRGERAKEPIFEADDIKEMVKHTVCLEYEEVTDITPDIRTTFYNSGHIIGGAMVHLHVGNGLHNILYTGDIKYARTNLLDATVTSFPRLETLLMESTYGGHDNVLPPLREAEKQLIAKVNETVKNGGKVLFPVLGSGRAQEVMLILHNAIQAGQLEKVPVVIDGMVWDITAIHTAYPEFLNTRVRRMIFHRDHNPFCSDIFRRIGSQKERMQIIEETGPCIVLATSGMLVGGPSVEYFRHLCENPKNALLFVSYQAEGSLGARIIRGVREVTMSSGSGQELLKINMEVLVIEGLSGHCDRQQLLNFAYRCNPRPKRIMVNHGEQSRCLDLASSLHKIHRVETSAPRNLECVRLR